MTWATERLDDLKAGKAAVPPVVNTLQLGTLDDWGPGWARKVWQATPDVLQTDGSLFGGYIAALADQILAFATMSVIPDGMGFRTVNLVVQFFHIFRDQDITIEARVVAQTRQLISLEATFTDPNGRIFAKASAQQGTVVYSE